MFTFLFQFGASQLDGSFPTGLGAALAAPETVTANAHGAPTAPLVINDTIALDMGAANGGGVQLGQLIVGAQNAGIGQQFLGQTNNPFANVFLLADLGWDTENAETVETARLRRVLDMGAGPDEDDDILNFTITTTTNGARRVDEKPIVRLSDSIIVISDAAAGDNVLRVGLIALTDAQAAARAGLVPT